jgi:type VI secretion system secreted protein VgrG
MATAYVLVNIDGQPLGQFSQDAILEQVEVVQEINQHWWCYVTCRQTEDRRFPIEDSIGKDLQAIAVDQDGSQTFLFSGLVLDAELEYEIFGSYTARLTGVSKTYLMDLAPRQKYYDYGQNTAPNVVNETISRAGLTLGDPPPPGDFPMPLVQWGETDYKLLVRIADDAFHFVLPNAQDGQTVNVKGEFADGPTLKWRTEDQLMSFRVRGRLGTAKMDGAHYNPIEGLSKNYTDVKGGPDYFDGASQMVSKVKEQSDAKLKNGYLTDRRSVLNLGEYDVLLQKEVNRALETGITGQGVSLEPKVTAGKKVIIQGVVNVEGTFGVTKVAHHWKPDGYTNDFWCTAASEYKDPVRPKSNPWYGVVIARVFDNNDPKKLGRVKVQYYWQADNQTFWARMMTPHAGSSRGFYFMPEVGDEVVVAFEDGDPERPIVLGCLWNNPDNPPAEDYWGGEYANNDVKRIITKSGHRIQLVDKQGKESISIATPTHLKISMVESSDENGRPTMTLHSDGDIFLDAPNGRIHCKSKLFSREVGDAPVGGVLGGIVHGVGDAAGGVGGVVGGVVHGVGDVVGGQKK